MMVVVDSVEAAITSIDRRVPDVILLSALMPPQDEAELFGHLRALPRGTSVQTLITPMPASPVAPKEQSRGWDLFKPRAQAEPRPCELSAFAVQLKAYLQQGSCSRPLDDASRDGRGIERRAASRVSNVDRARVLIDGVSVDLVDLSTSGAQVVSPAWHVPVRVVPATIADERETIRCDALVVWGSLEIRPSTQTPHYRAGVEWKGANHEFLKRLCRWAPAVR